MPEPLNKDKKKIMSTNLFPVVGVGASAGGLEAFKRLIRAIPEQSGIAFILVQHLEPTHESILTDILQKITRIPIQEITNNVRVEPNQIYIIPSNKLLMATDGVLQLSPRPAKRARIMPIDVFFASLAEIHQSHAIGVVLSGTGTDGTLGLKAIKEHGGITFAQEQQSAGSNGMPQSAIDAQVVDFVLTPEEIPLQLARLGETFKVDLPNEQKDPEFIKEDSFRQLLSMLRVRTGTDFTYYKQTTIRRRIIRRMGLNKMENISDYLAFFKDSKAEQDVLYHDLLIPVTQFFRDPKIFDTLCDTLLPALFKEREPNDPIRIWVAGCSTGEEPYSIAICLCEYLEEELGMTKIQIFATDLSEKSIAKARAGIYEKRDISGLSADRLRKYFTNISGNFHINRTIRDMCVFACHNFLKDPPFAKMDLISCRNVLIYMEPFLQKKALATFHYALKNNGYLLLGKSETAGPTPDLFKPLGKNDKFYTKNPVTGKFMQLIGSRNEKIFKEKASPVLKELARDDFQKSADGILLSKFTPPGVVINEQMDIVQFRGSTGKWLESSPGKPNLNVLKMAREGLAFELRSALHKAKAGNITTTKENIPIQFMGQQQTVSIEVIPLPNTVDPHFLILFKDDSLLSFLTEDEKKAAIPSGSAIQLNPDIAQIKALENELQQVREDMRSITEDQESVNEELQSANEELLSGSEELQSLNEELETSKEEIQSTNEELTTLNQELFDRNEQLNSSRIYAESVVATIREPLIILDMHMRVKTANKSYYNSFKTTEADTEGKLFYELGNGQWNMPNLRLMLENIPSNEMTVTDFEISHLFEGMGQRTLLLNVSRIFRDDDMEHLILLAIEDVTEIKKMEVAQKSFTQELEWQVEERTTELKNAIKSLKHSNENLEQFATIASHDLQEPLRKLRTFANLLNQRYNRDFDSEAIEWIKKINISAERMSTLITDVLNFSKVLDASVFKKADLNQILDNVINDFDMVISQTNAAITHDHLPIIEAIPLQINQLFYNLISNSLKFYKKGIPPVISIRSRILPLEDIRKHPGLNADFSFCEIIFVDNGIGFDQQYGEQIFSIFQRLNSREHFEGTGIGLALCKRTVLNHKGEIFVISKEGEGAQFHIILPLEQ